MTWPKVKLGDVCEINPRFTATLNKNDNVSFVPMSAVSEITGSVLEEQIICLSEVKNGLTPFSKEDILFAKITPCFENGKIAQANIRCNYGFGSTEFHVIRPNERADGHYLLHLLRTPIIREEGAKQMTGSAGQRRVPKHYLQNLEIPLPPIAEQKRLASILDRADALRQQRRDTQRVLDELAQSLFLELFGDPATNPKGWEVGTIKSISTSINYGTSQKSSDNGEIPYLRMNNITYSGDWNFSNLKYITLSEKDKEKFTVKAGNILFNRTNSAELVGKTGLYRLAEPMAFAGYLIRVRIDKENHPEYVASFMNLPYTKQQLRGICKSIIGMANINAQELGAMKIPLPPLALQQEFAAQIEELEAIKRRARESSTRLDALFAGLQARAFAGELSDKEPRA